MKTFFAALVATAFFHSTVGAELKPDIEYGRAGNKALLLDVSVPDGDGPFPVAIIIHGGGWSSGSKQRDSNLGRDISPLFAPLTRGNFTWFSIDYRLAPTNRWPAGLEDVQTAIRWVKAHAAEFKGDPRRIALIGHSAGGHLVCAAAVLAGDDTRVQAVVGLAAVTDLVADTTRRGEVSKSLQALLDRPQTTNAGTIKILHDISPINHVKPGLPPFLLMQGDADRTVPWSQSANFQAALHSNNVTCDLITLTNAPHRIVEWDKSDPNWGDKMVAWLQQTLGTTTNADSSAATSEPPVEWIDPDTGHRVVQLSREPGSVSLYFNMNAYTPDGQRLVISTPNGISVINLRTRAVEKIVDGRVHLLMVGHKTGQIYYTKSNLVFAADPITKTVREVAQVPPHGSAVTVNADETLLAGTITEPAETNSESAHAEEAEAKPVTKAKAIEDRFNQHLPMELFFLNLQTGEVKKFNRCTDWLNHLQFSPTDPNLLLFCHEGPWHNVDRIWTIRSDGTDLKLIHQRTMAMEIAGHEFWGADGKTIWYDLQTPRGEDFWVGGYNVTTGARTWYHLQRDEWSVHFNVSPDGKLFSGDGGGAGMVAHAKDGKWIYLFHPKFVPNRMDAGKTNLIQPGVFKAERLVNMAKHDYSLEPNANFTPDGKWLVFRSNMHGAAQVYAVEIEKADRK